MEITTHFTLTLEEYQEFQMEHLKAARISPYLKSARYKKRNLPFAIVPWILLLPFALLLLVFNTTPQWSPFAAFFLGMSPLYLVRIFRKSLIRKASRIAWNDDLEIKQPHTVIATDTTLTFEIPTKLTRYQWNHFKQFHESANLFLLYIAKTQAHIIPKRAFQSPADLDLFRQLCQSGAKNAIAPMGFPVQPTKVPPVQTLSQ